MALRVCPAPGCGELTEGGRCAEHRREADLARGTKQSRGYDADYDRARAAALASATHCSKCGGQFTAENPATGGHVKDIRAGGSTKDGIQAECRRCNLGWRKGTSE